jgi:integrase
MDKSIWPGQWKAFGSELMREDLAIAGIPYCVETVNGKEYADFHALRRTYSSALATVGTATKELQTLVRHSDPRLTLNTYTYVGSQALNEAVERLRMQGKATGNTPIKNET